MSAKVAEMRWSDLYKCNTVRFAQVLDLFAPRFLAFGFLVTVFPAVVGIRNFLSPFGLVLDSQRSASINSRNTEC